MTPKVLKGQEAGMCSLMTVISSSGAAESIPLLMEGNMTSTTDSTHTHTHSQQILAWALKHPSGGNHYHLIIHCTIN